MRINWKSRILKAFALSIPLSLFFPGASFAEDYRKPAFYLSGGLSVPVSPGEFTDLYNPGFNVGGGLGYIIDKIFTVRTYFDYNRCGLDTGYLIDQADVGDQDIDISGGDLNIITVTGELKTSVPLNEVKVWPYLLMGLGYFRIFIDDITIKYSGRSQTGGLEAENEFVILFGAGLDYKVSKAATIFAEFKYTIGFTEGENTHYVPIKCGLAF